jgi:hypothetical protein
MKATKVDSRVRIHDIHKLSTADHHVGMAIAMKCRDFCAKDRV